MNTPKQDTLQRIKDAHDKILAEAAPSRGALSDTLQHLVQLYHVQFMEEDIDGPPQYDGPCPKLN